MAEIPLVLPRRLAIEILYAAQNAQPESIAGHVLARGEAPATLCLGGLPPDARAWARLWSRPQQAAVPDARELVEGELALVVSLNTKGVLEMRAWRLRAGEPVEQPLAIRD